MGMVTSKLCAYKNIALTITIILALLTCEKSYSEVLSGVVNKEHVIKNGGIVVDQETGHPIKGATVSIPSKGIAVKTGNSGAFQLNMPDSTPMIISIEADGYKPFSLIIDEDNLHKPMKIAIAEQTTSELVIDTRLHHLGDDRFSSRSANSGDFSSNASGVSFFKEFFVKDSGRNNSVWLKIGSILGIDTIRAQSMRQSRVSTAFSSPVEVFFNSRKIGEIDYNGNNMAIRVPNELLRLNSYNHIKIETGVNLSSREKKDYDDIEFIHLVLEFK